ncbi:DUF2790 domain-containing protein [Pseudomonas aeruginosa]
MAESAASYGSQRTTEAGGGLGLVQRCPKVIGLTPTYGKCGIIPAQMSYVESKGEINILEYRAPGSDCRNEN